MTTDPIKTGGPIKVIQNLSAATRWRCLVCQGSLAPDDLGLTCRDCGKHYPVTGGVPILVREPEAYVRSELAALRQACRDAKQRIDLIERTGRDAGLPDVTLDRNREVFDAESAQAEAFLALLESPADGLEPLATDGAESPSAHSAGWTLDKLLPYLLRDWTDTAEFRDANAKIGAAIRQAFPDPSGKSLAFAGCGAGGLLGEVPPGFGRVVGYDLALPTLAAARRLLDGKGFDLPLPTAMHSAGRVALRRRGPPPAQGREEVVAMDALDTAFADGGLDCIVTMFLLDLMPDPRKLAAEIHRILGDGGVWINYGPSGNLNSLWRFDPTEGKAFFERAGFSVVQIEEHRTTNLDVSRDYPALHSRNVMCSLASARKLKQAEDHPRRAVPDPAQLSETVPLHFPGARLTYRLGAEATGNVFFQHEWIPGQPQGFEITGRAARIIALVNGNRTVGQIADLHKKQQSPNRAAEETTGAFERFFNAGLLTWRGREP